MLGIKRISLPVEYVYSSLSFSSVDTIQELQWMPESSHGAKLYILFLSYIYTLLIKYSVCISHSLSLSISVSLSLSIKRVKKVFPTRLEI